VLSDLLILTPLAVTGSDHITLKIELPTASDDPRAEWADCGRVEVDVVEPMSSVEVFFGPAFFAEVAEALPESLHESELMDAAVAVLQMLPTTVGMRLAPKAIVTLLTPAGARSLRFDSQAGVLAAESQ
jgi:hypothetical protein